MMVTTMRQRCILFLGLAVSLPPTSLALLTNQGRSNQLGKTRVSRASAFLSKDSDELEAEISGTGVSRRQLFSAIPQQLAVASVALSTCTFSPQDASALASGARGPVELLRPATRVKLYILQAIEICEGIKKKQQGGGNDADAASLLEPLVLYFQNEPETFLSEDEFQLSRRYLEIDTSSAWQAARLKEREERGKEIGIDYTTPYDKFNTAVQQFGDKNTFRSLRKRQRTLEQSSSIRAALNAYTNNLVFGNSYQLNAVGEEKKFLVRNDALPNVNAVVVSDLDIRDLYRNQVLNNMDDAKAELKYQLSTVSKNDGEDVVDTEEILNCLMKAKESCDEWFSFIPKDDIDDALRAVMAE